jgi:hypothetical protein
MKKFVCACLAVWLALAAAPTLALQLAPAAPNTMKVLALSPMNEGFSVVLGQQGFFFVTDSAISFTGGGWSCLSQNPISWFGVPKANPVAGGSGDNPAYRDHVNTLMLAYALNKPINLWVDGCLNGVPRVLGMELFP